jgi:hypothetical protein
MRLRSHRRNLAVRSQSVGSADRSGAPRFTRTRRIHRCIRTGALLAVVGLTPLARGGRPRWWGRARWWLLLAGGVLTVVGFMLRGATSGMVFLPDSCAWRSPRWSRPGLRRPHAALGARASGLLT